METALARPSRARNCSRRRWSCRTPWRDLARQALEVRRDFRRPTSRCACADLVRDTEPTYAHFEQLRQETERDISAITGIPEKSAEALIGGRWAGEGRGAARRAATWRNGDRMRTRNFVNDVRLATRVAAGVAERRRGREAGRLRSSNCRRSIALSACWRAATRLAEVHRRLMQHLAVAERWEIYNPKSRTANPRDWAWIGERLRALPG